MHILILCFVIAFIYNLIQNYIFYKKNKKKQIIQRQQDEEQKLAIENIEPIKSEQSMNTSVKSQNLSTLIK